MPYAQTERGTQIRAQVSGITGLRTSQMNGPEDCCTPQGDGKNDDAGLNLWLFEGMAGDLALDCTP